MSYSDSALEKKLSDLNNSQQSIQQLSLWLIHHRKHSDAIIKIWYKEMIKSQPTKKLTYLYLANDVIQNSRKKCPEMAKHFAPSVRKVVEHLAHIKLEPNTVKSIGRLITIWEERSIFDEKTLADMKKFWAKRHSESKVPPETEPGTPPMKKRKSDSRPKSSESTPKSANGTPVSISKDSGLSSLLPLLKGTLGTDKTSESDAPPEPETLIKALQDLENSASSDEKIREEIARLPTELSDQSHLDKLTTYEESQQFLVQVNQADELLTNYNDSLQKELENRKQVAHMIKSFLEAQFATLAKKEENLENFRDQLDKVKQIRADIKNHIQSLPDLTKLPDVTGGLAPLPSAGDLFTQNK